MILKLTPFQFFKHQLKYFKAANQIDDASDKLAADLIERLCLCVASLVARLLSAQDMHSRSPSRSLEDVSSV